MTSIIGLSIKRYLAASILFLFLFVSFAATAGKISYWYEHHKVGYDHPMIDAARKGDKENVRALLEYGYPADVRGYLNTTPLMISAYFGYESIVEMLLGHGADVNRKDTNRTSAFMLAAQGGQENIFRRMMQYSGRLSDLNDEQLLNMKEIILPIVPTDPQYTPQQHDDLYVAQMRIYQLMDSNQHLVLEEKYKTPEKGNTVRTVTFLTLGVGAAGGIAYALSGSGGGGSSPSETDSQYGLVHINAKSAYQRNYTGQGIAVAVLDSGVDIDHPDLAANILSNGFDFIGNDNDPSPEGQGDAMSHGTHIAGTIAAVKNNAGMHGIAYDAKIMPFRVGTTEAPNSAVIPAAINLAVGQNARVINLSLSSGFPITSFPDRASVEAFIGTSELNAYMSALTNNVGIVYAAGNNALDDPSIEAGIPYHIPELENIWLAVIAVDRSNNAAVFSNYCGVARNWCIAAPGVDIFAPAAIGDELDADRDGYYTISGTSMAAPHASASLAILLQAFPSLTVPQAIDILLNTATDLGVPGVDAIYGHGLINLNAATMPQGALMLPLDTIHDGHALNHSKISLSQPFGDALTHSSAELIVLDSYRRPYLLSFSHIINRGNNMLNSAVAFETFGAAENRNVVQLDPNASIHFSDALLDPDNGRGEDPQVSFRKTLGDRRIAMNQNIPLGEAFGFAADNLVKPADSITGTALSNPFWSFARNGASFLYQQLLSRDNVLRFGAWRGYPDALFYAAGNADNIGIAGEFVKNITEGASLGFQTGMMQEKKTLLGSAMEGAFAIHPDTPTWFYGFQGNMEVAQDTRVLASFTQGVSFPSTSTYSFFEHFSPLYSQSLSLGSVINNVVLARDSFGVVVTQPLRISSGTADVVLPAARELSGNVRTESYTMSLVPRGREVDAEMFYAVPLGQTLSFHAASLYRYQPGHDVDARPEAVLMTRVNMRF